MAYKKSYFQQRQEEQARIREAIRAHVNNPEIAEAIIEKDYPEEAVVEPSDVPDKGWKKADIQDWLTDKEIEWDSSMTKSELLGLI